MVLVHGKNHPKEIVLENLGVPLSPLYPMPWQQKSGRPSIKSTLQQTNISHQSERKLIFPTALGWDMLVPRRVSLPIYYLTYLVRYCFLEVVTFCFHFFSTSFLQWQSSVKYSIPYINQLSSIFQTDQQNPSTLKLERIPLENIV